MTRAAHSGATSPRRAHRSLLVLSTVSVLAAGGLSTAVSAPPSAAAGLAFALSALLLVAGTTLAARVVIALDRAKRAARAPTPPLAEDFPMLTRLLGVRVGGRRRQDPR